MRIEILNKEIRDMVDVLRCLKLYHTLSKYDLSFINSEVVKQDDKHKFISPESIEKTISIGDNRLLSTLDKLVQKGYVDKSENSYKINNLGIGYLEYKTFNEDQLKHITNNPIRRMENFAKIFSFAAALIALLVSVKNCNRVGDLEDKNISITESKPISANAPIRQTINNPNIADNFSINIKNFMIKN